MHSRLPILCREFAIQLQEEHRMSEQKKEPKKLEEYEPGVTKEQVMAALVKTAKPVKKQQR